MSGALLEALEKAPADAGADSDDDEVVSMAEAAAERELMAALKGDDPKRIRKVLKLLRELDDE